MDNPPETPRQLPYRPNPCRQDRVGLNLPDIYRTYEQECISSRTPIKWSVYYCPQRFQHGEVCASQIWGASPTMLMLVDVLAASIVSAALSLYKHKIIPRLQLPSKPSLLICQLRQNLFEQAKQHIPGGVNSPVRAFKGVGGVPVFVDHAVGPYLTDTDGKRYIDYVGSWGPMVLGHAHPDVLSAIRAAATLVVTRM